MSGRRAWVSPVLLPALLALEAIIEAVFAPAAGGSPARGAPSQRGPRDRAPRVELGRAYVVRAGRDGFTLRFGAPNARIRRMLRGVC